MGNRVQGKVAFLTGASEGIGAAAAERFAEEGATVVICARREGPLTATAERIRAAGGTVHAMALDVGDAEAYRGALLEAAGRFGHLDILVNNAMDASMAMIEDQSLDGWRHAFRINVEAAVVGTQAVFPLMRRHGGGAIVNVVSVLALRAMVGTSAYGASKAALLQFSRVAAMEGAPHGIRVNTIAPGSLDTPAMRAAIDTEQKLRAVNRSIPMGHVGRALDGANAILFLASDEASHVTGVCISVDGGLAVELKAPDVYGFRD